MYQLYNVKTWGSICVHLLLEEMEVPYTNIWMTPEQVRARAYRAISPLGFIPALGLKDGRTLFESAAIVGFLVTAHPEKHMAPPPGSDDYGEFLSWLQFMASNLYTTINMTFRESPYAIDAAHDEHIVKAATEKVHDLWSVIEKRLAGGPWMMGGSYSALDIYAFMLSLWSKPSEQEIHDTFPRIAYLASGIRARPKLKAALEAHEVMQIGGYAG
jgi:glutathione S-transferase